MDPHINCQEFQFYVYKTCDIVFFCKVNQNVRKQKSVKMAKFKKCSQTEKQTIKLHYVSGYV